MGKFTIWDCFLYLLGLLSEEAITKWRHVERKSKNEEGIMDENNEVQ